MQRRCPCPPEYWGGGKGERGSHPHRCAQMLLGSGPSPHLQAIHPPLESRARVSRLTQKERKGALLRTFAAAVGLEEVLAKMRRPHQNPTRGEGVSKRDGRVQLERAALVNKAGGILAQLPQELAERLCWGRRHMCSQASAPNGGGGRGGEAPHQRAQTRACGLGFHSTRCPPSPSSTPSPFAPSSPLRTTTHHHHQHHQQQQSGTEGLSATS